MTVVYYVLDGDDLPDLHHARPAPRRLAVQRNPKVSPVHTWTSSGP